MITKENKAQAISLTNKHQNDVGSDQAQASILTSRIQEITAHLKVNKKDKMARRGLIQMVSRRKSLLKHLESKDYESYKKTVSKLKLRK